ncbi:MAG: hypothetical protein JXQ83_00100 [Candidatus Glassbacteria bacterium]|nr:hypothetical protein [Candidatus Glassbacteria bacterium]
MISTLRLSFIVLALGLQTAAPAGGGPPDDPGKIKAVVFEDDFESVAGQTTLDRWQGVSPVWQVDGSETRGLIQDDTRPITRQVLYTPGLEWRDYRVLCRLRIERWGGQTKNFAWSGSQYRRVYWSVALRVAGAADGYRLEYAPWVPEDGGAKQSFYRIVKYTGGQRTELARVLSSFHSDLDYLVRFEACGDSLRARVWPAGKREPGQWTVTAVDTDHAAGTVSFITANAAVFFGEVVVEDLAGRRLLEENFDRAGLPDTWRALSGSWRCAPWGRRLVSRTGEGRVLRPAPGLPLPAEISLRARLESAGVLSLLLYPDSPAGGRGGTASYRLELTGQGAAFFDLQGRQSGAEDLALAPGKDYTLRIKAGPQDLKLLVEPFPLATGQAQEADFRLPVRIGQLSLGLDPSASQGVSLDDLSLEATVAVDLALREYLRYICDWYMGLELPNGYPKAGTGSPELFIASYCVRTLMAGAQILGEPAYLEEALRWADFVCSSPSVLVPLVTGTGTEALAVRTFADWSACINLADIGSVMLAVGVLYPWGDDQRRARYLEVMEKYSLYVTEGCLEDPLILGRGNRPQGWRVDSGPDRGAFGNGYWWMDRSEAVWDVSTTNVGLQFYPVLYAITGNPEYRRYAVEAADWYLRREVETGAVFEAFHDVVYGGEALVTAYEHAADEALRARIDAALGQLCRWIVENQNPDGTWNQAETPRNNRTNLVWRLLDWYGRRHPADRAVRQALQRTLEFHLDRDNSRDTGVCEVLRKTCFTGVSVAELIEPGSTVRLRRLAP